MHPARRKLREIHRHRRMAEVSVHLRNQYVRWHRRYVVLSRLPDRPVDLGALQSPARQLFNGIRFIRELQEGVR